VTACFICSSSSTRRRNNYIEGWHKKFSSLLDCYHPNIWKFLDKIKESQSLMEIMQTQLTADQLPRIGLQF